MKRSKRPPPIQLYLLTGFLGSGKTTLLNNLLELSRKKRTGIIINEFGETVVDRSMIDHRDREMICVVDTLQLLDLVQVVPAVYNQIVRSEIILVNKVDLVEESVVEEIEGKIRQLQPEANIYRTTYCRRVDQGQILSID